MVFITKLRKATDKNGEVYYWGSFGAGKALLFKNKTEEGALNFFIKERPQSSDMNSDLNKNRTPKRYTEVKEFGKDADYGDNFNF